MRLGRNPCSDLIIPGRNSCRKRISERDLCATIVLQHIYVLLVIIIVFDFFFF